MSSNGSRPISLDGWERPGVAQLAMRATSSSWFALVTIIPPLSTTPTRGELLDTQCCRARGFVGHGGSLGEEGFRGRSFRGGGFPGGEGFRVKRVFGGGLQDIFVQAISRVSHDTLSIQCLNKPSSIVTSFSAQLPQPLQPRHRSPSGVLSLLLGCLFHITKKNLFLVVAVVEADGAMPQPAIFLVDLLAEVPQ